MERKWDRKVMLLVWGELLGLVVVVLTSMGNPGNMVFCIACFTRDIAGAAKFHTTAVVQYMRPEIVGLVVDSFAVSMAAKEYRSTSSSSPMIQFLLEMMAMIGVLIFLRCPLRMVLRMATSDLDTYVGPAGLALGAATGCFFLRKGFSLGRAYSTRSESGYILPVTLVVMLILSVTTVLFAVSAEGPGGMHAPVPILLVGGLIFGATAQRARTCFAGGIRDVILTKNFDLLTVITGLFVVMVVYNLATGGLKLGSEGQPVAHTRAVWNVLGMYVVGSAAILAGGCPLRQLILVGQESGDAVVNVAGMLVRAAVCHNFGLVSSGTDITVAGRIMCAVCTVLLFVIGSSCKGKQGKQEGEDRISEIDVRGLSRPELMLIVMDEMDKHPGVKLIVLSDAAYARGNIAKLAKEYGREAVVAMRGRDIEIAIS